MHVLEVPTYLIFGSKKEEIKITEKEKKEIGCIIVSKFVPPHVDAVVAFPILLLAFGSQNVFSGLTIANVRVHNA